MTRAQGKHREFSLNQSVATLDTWSGHGPPTHFSHYDECCIKPEETENTETGRLCQWGPMFHYSENVIIVIITLNSWQMVF